MTTSLGFSEKMGQPLQKIILRLTWDKGAIEDKIDFMFQLYKTVAYYVEKSEFSHFKRFK